eukprot:gb/GECG01002734.1/.p1 GENE.gb/GECG01002734.1/~~gb/GECG01002734.1/.p1  ORF type:complete len:2084 (+),score=391.13 gb/GECG01002734.1/:1-6252(+)
MGDNVDISQEEGYDPASVAMPMRYNELDRSHLALQSVFGLDFSRLNNLHVVEKHKILFVTGNTAIILDLDTLNCEYITGHDGGGIGCAAVHRDGEDDSGTATQEENEEQKKQENKNTWIAIGEKGRSPNIYIYHYPTLKLVRVLRRGTEQAFSDVNFNRDGSRLLSVGAEPDFLLTVWDWKNEKMLLRSKAFSQDVFNARFSPFDDEKLTTSGTGHIRFWQMANTFTGLKLKGYIGKFGLVDLSDVADFAELPDGKILSSSESGRLLLWEGNFIKCEISRLNENDEEALCHDGTITCVRYDAFNELFVTAGSDGFMRWWKFADIDTADSTEEQPRALLRAHSEKLCDPSSDENGEDIGVTIIRNICQLDASCWFVEDERGVLWKLNTETEKMECVLCAHSGPISASDACTEFPLVATAGFDGTVRAWDITKYNLIDAQFCSAKFSSEATSLTWLPTDVCAEGNEVLAGFKDGVVRSLALWPNKQTLSQITRASLVRSDKLEVAERGWVRRQVFKPHNAAVNCIAFRPSSDIFATGGEDGNVFFINVVKKEESIEYQPLGFVAMGVPVRKIAWAGDGQYLLATVDDEWFAALSVPETAKEFPSIEHTFEIGLPWTRFTLNLPDRPSPQGDRSSSASPANEDGEGAESGDDDEEKIDPETLKRRPGTVKSIFESPWSIECTDEAAVSSDARQELSKISRRSIPTIRVCASVENDLREFLLEVCISQADISSVKEKSLNLAAVYANSEESLSTFSYDSSQKTLVVGANDGSVTLRSRDHPFYYARADPHDAFSGNVTSVMLSTQGRFLVSSGQDGCINIMRCQVAEIARKAKESYEAIEKERKERAIIVKPDIPNHPQLPPVVPVSSGGNAAIAGPKDEETSKPVSPVKDQTPPGMGPGKLMPVGALGEDNFPGPDGNPLDKLAERAPSPQGHEPKDIVSQDAYSLQDAKLKAEDDQKKELAEEEKDKVRGKVKELRKEFAHLRTQMGMPIPYDLFPELEALQREASEEEQERAKDFLRQLYPSRPTPFLSEEELVIDSELNEIVQNRCNEKIEEAKKEVAFDVAKSQKGVEKLEKAFIEDVKVENFVVKGIRNSKLSVKSFRDSYLSPSLRQSLEEIKRLLRESGLSDEAEDEPRQSAEPAEEKRSSEKKHEDFHKDDPLTPLMGEAASIQGNSFNARKERRLARKKALEIIEGQRPGPDDVDPRDVAAIKSSAENTGAYSLKTDPDFHVPEHKRVDAAKKRRQMVLLEKCMHTLKDGFNNKLLQLRSIKEGCKHTIAGACQRIFDLNRKLGDNCVTLRLKDRTQFDVNDIANTLGLSLTENGVQVSSEADPEEWPESRIKGKLSQGDRLPERFQRTAYGILTPTDIYRKYGYGDRFRHKANVALFNNLYRHAPSGMYPVATTSPSTGGHALSALASWGESYRFVPGISAAIAAENAKGGLSSTAKNLEEQAIDDAVTKAASPAQRRQWESDRKQLLSRIAKAVEGFDEALRYMRGERVKLACDLKAGELRFLALFRELQLLRDMAKQDTSLTEKLNKSLANKSEIQQTIAEYRNSLENKKNELQEWTDKEEKLAEQFRELVPETHEASAELFQIFKRKIKRRKQDEGEGDESESDSEIDWDESDSDDDNDLLEDRCPENCSETLFESVLDLRETRLDQEEKVQELQKEIDELKKNYERQVQREKTVDKELSKIREQIQEFQSEKQGRLNEVEVATTLKFSQIFAGARNVKFSEDPVDEEIRKQFTPGENQAAGGENQQDVTKTKQQKKQSKEAEKLKLKESENPDDIVQRYNERVCIGDGNEKNGQLLPNLDQFVLMSKDSLSALRNRIDQLKHEITELRSGFKTFHKQKRALQKERKQVEQQISDYQQQSEELQRLKFGQTVDLEHLDKVSQTRNVEKAEAELTKQEDKQRAEVNSYTEQINSEQQKVIQTTKDNTVLLQHIAELTSRQAKLETQLNSAMESKPTRGRETTSEADYRTKDASIQHSVNALVSEEKEPRVGSEREQAQLQELIEYQAQQIDLLQQQINALRYKGGHIYTAATPQTQNSGEFSPGQSSKRAPPPSSDHVQANALEFDDTPESSHK